MIPVKICGITSCEDAEIAVNYGASAIGMIFYEGSPRYIYPDNAEEWIGAIPSKMKKVGVFVNEKWKNIKTIVEKLNLDYIQLHGDESPEYCDKMIRPVIKTFRVGLDFDPAVLGNFHVHAFLFDTFQKGKPGGTGRSFNWDLISGLKRDTPIILSGGLNPDNINEGIETVHPSAVDVNSGVESEPGIKDKGKMEKLFNTIEQTYHNAHNRCVFDGTLS
jgi:phosphoribosylanthranilate isomerase